MDFEDFLRRLLLEDGSFGGRAVLACWGSEVAIEVSADGSTFPEDQRENLRALLAWPRSIRSAFEVAVATHYREDVYGTFVDDDDSEPPQLSADADIWNLVGAEATFRLRDVDDVQPLPCFDVLLECAWDSEHGLQVSFEEGGVVYVGGQ